MTFSHFKNVLIYDQKNNFDMLPMLGKQGKVYCTCLCRHIDKA